jgi:predicted transposase YbfD/YdcC
VSRYEEEVIVAHGRIEHRRIIACPMPRTHGWESVKQCFAITRTRIDKKRNLSISETAYGITSLPSLRADAKRLLGLNRGHWGIENKLHWVRDSVFKEDASTLRSRNVQTINAACNSLAIFLLKQAGFQSITHAIETCADDKSIPINLLYGN